MPKQRTTANLGACLAHRGLRTLLIDLDPQANLTLGLGADTNIMHHSLSEVFLTPEKVALAAVIQRVGDKTLYLAPGHVDMARTEALLPHKAKTDEAPVLSAARCPAYPRRKARLRLGADRLPAVAGTADPKRHCCQQLSVGPDRAEYVCVRGHGHAEQDDS